jgi:hypothetical protein
VQGAEYVSTTRLRALYQLRAFDDHFIYEELAVPRDQRKMPMVRLLPELAIESFRAWQEHQSKIAY